MQALLLDIVEGTGDKAGRYYFDNKAESLIYALIGFLVVFAGIVILILIIWLIGLLMKKTNNLAAIQFWKRKDRMKKPEGHAEYVADVTQKAIENKQLQKANDDIPDDIKAAIVAAVSAMYYEEDKCDFVVKSIKRL